jgi:hypothetical protein
VCDNAGLDKISQHMKVSNNLSLMIGSPSKLSKPF